MPKRRGSVAPVTSWSRMLSRACTCGPPDSERGSVWISLSLTQKNAILTGAYKEGARRARKADRRLRSGCVGPAAVGSESWLLREVSGVRRGEVPAWTRS